MWPLTVGASCVLKPQASSCDDLVNHTQVCTQLCLIWRPKDWSFYQAASLEWIIQSYGLWYHLLLHSFHNGLTFKFQMCLQSQSKKCNHVCVGWFVHVDVKIYILYVGAFEAHERTCALMTFSRGLMSVTGKERRRCLRSPNDYWAPRGVKWLLNVLFTFLPPQISSEPAGPRF